jgi:hypothetical protein
MGESGENSSGYWSRVSGERDGQEAVGYFGKGDAAISLIFVRQEQISGKGGCRESLECVGNTFYSE